MSPQELLPSGFFLGTEKKRKILFENGKDMVANEKDVWRIAKRLEFEGVTTFDNVRPGQTVRVTLASSARDFFGVVDETTFTSIKILQTWGIENSSKIMRRTDITEITEICSSDSFYMFRKLIDGEQAGNSNIK